MYSNIGAGLAPSTGSSLMIQRLSLISQYQLPTAELYRGVAQLVNIERFKEVYYAADLWFYTV